MSSAGEGTERPGKSEEDAVRNLLGMGASEAPLAAGEVLFDDYEDGRGIDGLLGIVREPADDAEDQTPSDDVVVDTVRVDDEFDDELIVFDEDDDDDFDGPTDVSVTDATDEPDISDEEDADLVFSEDSRDAEEVRETPNAGVEGPRRQSEPVAGKEQSGDDPYWNELDRWVWDDEPPESALESSPDDPDEDEEEDEFSVSAGESSSDVRSSSLQDDADEGERPRRGRRGRRGPSGSPGARSRR